MPASVGLFQRPVEEVWVDRSHGEEEACALVNGAPPRLADIIGQ